MTVRGDLVIDELGPVDYTVIEFPPGRQVFSGELADELLRLVDAEVVRVLELLVLSKHLDGTVQAVEIADSGAERDDIRGLEVHVPEFLPERDVADLAAAMAPGSVAGVVVWENTWAAPFTLAARRTGGQLVASGRIPVPTVAASLGVGPGAGG